MELNFGGAEVNFIANRTMDRVPFDAMLRDLIATIRSENTTLQLHGLRAEAALAEDPSGLWAGDTYFGFEIFDMTVGGDNGIDGMAIYDLMVGTDAAVPNGMYEQNLHARVSNTEFGGREYGSVRTSVSASEVDAVALDGLIRVVEEAA